MKGLQLVVLCVFAYGGASADKGYHEKVGIPLATKIKRAEIDIFNESSELSSKIVGGFVPSKYSHPYLAGLLIDFKTNKCLSTCGASIVSTSRLVTAAHCWFDGHLRARKMEVVLGSNHLYHGGIRMATSKVVMHPQFNATTLESDVAVVYLPKTLYFTSKIQPISLPDPYGRDKSKKEYYAKSLGYGKTHDHESSCLKENAHVWEVDNLLMVPERFCKKVYTKVPANTICVGTAYTTRPMGPCEGDSGGPLVVERGGRNVLIGIISSISSLGCQKSKHSMYTNVTSYYNFIKKNTVTQSFYKYDYKYYYFYKYRRYIVQ